VLFWDQLLQVVDERHVVPIVGADLLTVRTGERSNLFYSMLATRLARYLEVAEDPAEELDLNTVAYRYLARGNAVEDLYPALKSVIPADDEVPIPEPLLKLAAVDRFQLFVSTTFDPLLERALNQVRFGGQKKTEVYSFSPSTRGDLPVDLDTVTRPTVFHLFGRASAVPLSFAITQEDTLEFFYSLQSDARRPNALLDMLNRQSLLVMGSSFGDWPARFFLRATNRQRLLEVRSKSDYVAESQMNRDKSLVMFLHHFSRGTKIYEGDPVQFVDEFSRRWIEQHRPPLNLGGIENSAVAVPPSVRPGKVFLSYASEDAEAVSMIRDALESSGVDVFFDKKELEGGDDWELKLRRSIGKSSLFVPIISRSTLTPSRRYFRAEWNYGIQEALRSAWSERFIVPVAIDGTRRDEDLLPEEFKKFQWEVLPDGRPTPEFVNLIRLLFREYQKSLEGT
jgi:TIR domain/SIR2-like domain